MKKVFAIILVVLFSLNSLAMDSPLDKMPTQIIGLMIKFMSCKSQMNFGLTCRKLNKIVNTFGLKSIKVTDFKNEINGHISFCSSKKMFCIIHSPHSESQDYHANIKIFDGCNLKEREVVLDSVSANGCFASHKDGICYAQGKTASLINVDDDVVINMPLPINVSGLITYDKIYTVNDHIIITDNRYVTVYSSTEDKYKSVGISNVTHFSGIKKVIYLFRKEDYVYLFNCPDYTVNETRCLFDELPIVTCVENPDIMVTYHEGNNDLKKRLLKTYSIDEHSSNRKSQEIKLNFPATLLVRKLFLKENFLIIMGAHKSSINWVLIMYDLDKEQIIFHKNLKGQPSDVHLAGNNIFAIFRNHKEENKNIEVFAFSIAEWL